MLRQCLVRVRRRVLCPTKGRLFWQQFCQDNDLGRGGRDSVPEGRTLLRGLREAPPQHLSQVRYLWTRGVGCAERVGSACWLGLLPG